MYNAHLHHKRQLADCRTQSQNLQASKLVSRSLLVRSQLAANYNRRIDHFIYAMLNDPIRVREYVKPLQVAGRVSQPEKYLGRPAMVYRDRRREESWPKKSVDLEAEVSMSSSSSSQEPLAPPKPAAVLMDLHRKTYFKAVMTKLMQENKGAELSLPDAVHRTKTAAIVYAHSKALNQFATAGTMAKDALQTCQVIPKGTQEHYLRVGEGRLTSNPFTPTNQLYSQLYPSRSFSSL